MVASCCFFSLQKKYIIFLIRTLLINTDDRQNVSVSVSVRFSVFFSSLTKAIYTTPVLIVATQATRGEWTEIAKFC